MAIAARMRVAPRRMGTRRTRASRILSRLHLPSPPGSEKNAAPMRRRSACSSFPSDLTRPANHWPVPLPLYVTGLFPTALFPTALFLTALFLTASLIPIPGAGPISAADSITAANPISVPIPEADPVPTYPSYPAPRVRKLFPKPKSVTSFPTASLHGTTDLLPAKQTSYRNSGHIVIVQPPMVTKLAESATKALTFMGVPRFTANW